MGLFQIGLVTGNFHILPFQRREIAALEGVVDCLIQRFRIQVAARDALGDRDGLVVLVIRRLAVSSVPFAALGRFGDQFLDVDRIQLQGRFQLHIVAAAGAGQIVEYRHKGAVGPAKGQRFPNGLLCIQRHLGLLRLKDQGLVRQADLQALGGIGVGHSLLHLSLCRHDGQAAHIDACHPDIGEDGLAAFQLAAVGINADEGHQQHSQHNGRHRSRHAFFPFGCFSGSLAGSLFGRGRLPVACLFRHLCTPFRELQ